MLFWCLLFMVFVQSDKYQILWIWHEYGESAQGSNTTSLMMTLEKYNGIWCGDVTRKVASFISNQLYWYTLVTTITCYFCCFWSLLCSLWGWSPSTEQIFFALVFLQNYIVLKSKQKVDERCLAGNEAFWHDTVFSRDRQMTIILFRIFSALFLSFFKNKNCPDKNTLWDEHWRGVAKKDT